MLRFCSRALLLAPCLLLATGCQHTHVAELLYPNSFLNGRTLSASGSSARPGAEGITEGSRRSSVPLADAYGRKRPPTTRRNETPQITASPTVEVVDRPAKKQVVTQTRPHDRSLLFVKDAEARPFPQEPAPRIELADYLQAPAMADAEPDPFVPEPVPDPNPLPTAKDEQTPVVRNHVIVDGLSIDEAVSIALAKNPTLAQSGWTVRKALGSQDQVGRRPNPTFGYRGEEIGDNGSAGNQGLFFAQTIVLGKKLELSEQVAAQAAEALRWQVETQRYRVRNDVRTLYYNALGAQQRVQLARELHDLASDGVTSTKDLKQIGEASQADVLQAEIQLQEVDILLRNAQFAYVAAWKQLTVTMGTPGRAMQPLNAALEIEETPRDYDLAMSQLVALSPQLSEAKALVEQARRQIFREQVQPIPNLNLQLGVMHMDQSDSQAANIQVGVPLPIFNKNEGNISRAHAEYQRACWNVRRLELRLQSDLARAFQTYEQALNRVRTYRDEIVPREKETLNLIESVFPDQFGFLRLLSARRSYFQARMQYLSALVDLRQAEVAVDGLLLSGALEDMPGGTIDDGNRGKALSGQ